MSAQESIFASAPPAEANANRAWPVFGHDWAITFLRRIAAPGPDGQRDRLRHAYLFLGEPALGKGTLARCFANALLCPESTDRACGRCAPCQAFRHGNHPDFMQIDPVDSQGQPDRRTGLLRVEQTETLLHHVHLRPFQSPYRIVLIRDMQRAHPAFMNKLLKTFEEPPAAVILLATATAADRLLPTVVSRCQALPLRRVPRPLIQEALTREHGVDAARADLLSRLAHGCMGWALTHCRRDDLWEERNATRTLLAELVRGNALSRLARVDELARARTAGRQAVQGHISFWLSWWRDVWLYQYHRQDACVNVDCREDLEATAHATHPEAVARYLYRLEQAHLYVNSHVNTRLLLANLMLHMPSLSSSVG